MLSTRVAVGYRRYHAERNGFGYRKHLPVGRHFTYKSNMTLIAELLRGFSQLIYPNLCWACHTVMGPDGGLFCGDCLPQLTIDLFPTCPRCSSSVGPYVVLNKGCTQCTDHTFGFDGAFRAGPYDGLLREVILRMKAWPGEDLTEALATVWADAMAERLKPLTADCVIPIPLHWRRRWWRGFNQSEILSLALAKKLDVPCLLKALQRTRHTASQTAQSSATGRKENVHNAFETAKSLDLAGKTVLLVDDVLTTGATASEAAKALRMHKPKAIYAVVVAHGR